MKCVICGKALASGQGNICPECDTDGYYEEEEVWRRGGLK